MTVDDPHPFAEIVKSGDPRVRGLQLELRSITLMESKALFFW